MDAGCLESCIASSGIQCYFYVIKATLYLKCHRIVTSLLYRLTHIFTCIVPVWQPYSIAYKFKSTEQIQSIRRLKMALSVCDTKYLLYLQSIMTPVGRGRVVPPTTSLLSPPHINQPSVCCLLKWISLSVPSHLTLYQLEMALRWRFVSFWDTFYICQKPLSPWQGSRGHSKGEKEVND